MLDSKCVSMCISITMTIPEKEMYSKLNFVCVFLSTLELSWQPCTQPLVLSWAKGLWEGEGIE